MENKGKSTIILFETSLHHILAVVHYKIEFCTRNCRVTGHGHCVKVGIAVTTGTVIGTVGPPVVGTVGPPTVGTVGLLVIGTTGPSVAGTDIAVVAVGPELVGSEVVVIGNVAVAVGF